MVPVDPLFLSPKTKNERKMRGKGEKSSTIVVISMSLFRTYDFLRFHHCVQLALVGTYTFFGEKSKQSLLNCCSLFWLGFSLGPQRCSSSCVKDYVISRHLYLK